MHWLLLTYCHAQSLEEQFPHEEGYRISAYNDFKFTNNNTERTIEVVVLGKHNHCIIALEPANGKVPTYSDC